MKVFDPGSKPVTPVLNKVGVVTLAVLPSEDQIPVPEPEVILPFKFGYVSLQVEMSMPASATTLLFVIITSSKSEQAPNVTVHLKVEEPAGKLETSEFRNKELVIKAEPPEKSVQAPVP